MTMELFRILNITLLFVFITLLFAIIFMVLPDGRVKWRDTIKGSFFTALLFMVGKFAIGFYLSRSHIATTYGAAGSLIIILLWVYYSAIILYFGAEFTKVYAETYGKKIIPNDYAVRIVPIEIENEDASKSKDGK